MCIPSNHPHSTGITLKSETQQLTYSKETGTKTTISWETNLFTPMPQHFPKNPKQQKKHNKNPTTYKAMNSYFNIPEFWIKK